MRGCLLERDHCKVATFCEGLGPGVNHYSAADGLRWRVVFEGPMARQARHDHGDGFYTICVTFSPNIGQRVCIVKS